MNEQIETLSKLVAISLNDIIQKNSSNIDINDNKQVAEFALKLLESDNDTFFRIISEKYLDKDNFEDCKIFVEEFLHDNIDYIGKTYSDIAKYIVEDLTLGERVAREYFSTLLEKEKKEFIKYFIGEL